MELPPTLRDSEMLETLLLWYCGIMTNCSAVVTRDSFEQMGVFEIGMTV